MLFSSLEQIAQSLQRFRARRKWWRRWARRSAVALLLREGAAGVEVLMIKRAERQGDRWAGHMGFPGGVLHADDRNSLAGAMRETQEEIGVDLAAHGRLLTGLSDLVTVPHLGQRRPLIISPYVFALDALPPLALNGEVAEVVWVPLRFFADRSNRGSIDWHGLRLASYLFRGHRIWGLSLQMVDELLQQLGVAPAPPGALRQSG
jgi:8-oxo-dGTP pyrophosphatase MutT (NUDIX family)